mmetsp:Transcript_61733/g.127593  ORF Transcript_61733/g.127593 Transcript_61733/m.127593 type:complete len:97 (-) Transcript_61733:127-417(-)
MVGQQTGMQGIEMPQYQDRAEFDDMPAAFAAHIPGAPNPDCDAQFREQIFGEGFGYDTSIYTSHLPPWEDPCEPTDNTIPNNNRFRQYLPWAKLNP